MIAGLLIVHLLSCALTAVLLHQGRLRTRSLILPAVVFIPFWGFLLLALEEYEERRAQMGTKEIGLESLKIQDVKYRRIEVDESRNQDITVPLEEAMLVNDASVRRKLMMDILHKNPEEYIGLLQTARTTEDTELAHYATTTMMEIQGRYETAINQFSEELKSDPENRQILRRFRRELKKYINSGLLSGNILDIYRGRLDDILTKLCAGDADNRKYALERVDNRIALGRLQGLEEELAQALRKWPGEMRVYQLCVEYYWHTGQGDKIREILNRISKEEVYLTSEEREWYEFWEQKELEV